MCVADLNRSFSPEGTPALFDDAAPSDGEVIPMNQSAGAYWEERALELIVSRDTIITRNYSSRFGEIDLIASDSGRPTVTNLTPQTSPLRLSYGVGISGEAIKSIYGVKL